VLLTSCCWQLYASGVRPEQVDILVTNCSIFSATPSLASMLINKFKFRTDVQSYHLVRAVMCRLDILLCSCTCRSLAFGTNKHN